jgi:hypothetical protein
LIHGVEVVNEDLLEPQTLAWLEEKKLTILANSDVHQLVDVRPGFHRSPITLVFARARDLDGLREAFTARRTVAWRQNELWGAADLLTGLFHASVTPAATRIKASGATLRLRNNSAIPYDVTFSNLPAWLTIAPATIAAEAESGIHLSVASKTKPAGVQKVDLELELRNAHIPNGGNARTRLSIEIE